MKKQLIVVIVVFVVVIGAVIALRLLTPEDAWVCENGEWVRHGNPSADMPESGCGEAAPADSSNQTIAESCADSGGTWLEEYQECENASADWCQEESGGQFEECASACRHDPEAEMCTLQCVPVCGFATSTESAAKGVENATYTLDGQSITLHDGQAIEQSAPGAAAKVTTILFGEPVTGDMDGDGVDDAGVILVRSGGGSGTFYYAAAAIYRGGAYQGTNAILLGDRIAPQSSDIKRYIYTVNYAERESGDAMTVAPSVGVSKYLSYDGEKLVEADRNDDLIRIFTPHPGETISSPLSITGEARGNWYFEASFPVSLVDWDGRIIAEGVASAQGDWMTEDYVPFTAELDFTADTTVSDRGALILKKDNPSGLPENDNSLEVTVYFSKQ